MQLCCILYDVEYIFYIVYAMSHCSLQWRFHKNTIAYEVCFTLVLVLLLDFKMIAQFLDDPFSYLELEIPLLPWFDWLRLLIRYMATATIDI